MQDDLDVRPGRSVPAGGLGRLPWRKAAASGAGNCVELAPLAGGAVAVRHSLDPLGPALVYSRSEIAAFVRGAKAGEFDDLTI